MLSQNRPSLRLIPLRLFPTLHSLSLNRFSLPPHPLLRAFLMRLIAILAAVRFIYQIFFACFVMRNQLVLAVTNQFLASHFGNRFAQEMEEIAASVDEFDFEAAKKPIRKIAAELNIKWDGADDE